MLSELEILRKRAVGEGNDEAALQAHLAVVEYKDADPKQREKIVGFLEAISAFRGLLPDSNVARRIRRSKTAEGVRDLVDLFNYGLWRGTINKDYYRYAKVVDLTPKELERNRLPERSTSISVAVTSEKGRHYKAKHFLNGTLSRPYINLRSTERDFVDFEDTEQMFVDVTGGKLAYMHGPEGAGLKTRIDLDGQLTQQMVAGFVKEYEEHFPEVKIPAVNLVGVNRFDLRNAHFPPERVFVG